MAALCRKYLNLRTYTVGKKKFQVNCTLPSSQQKEFGLKVVLTAQGLVHFDFVLVDEFKELLLESQI